MWSWQEIYLDFSFSDIFQLEALASVVILTFLMGHALGLPIHALGHGQAVANQINCLCVPNRARASKKVGRAKALGLHFAHCPTILGTTVTNPSQPKAIPSPAMQNVDWVMTYRHFRRQLFLLDSRKIVISQELTCDYCRLVTWPSGHVMVILNSDWCYLLRCQATEWSRPRQSWDARLNPWKFQC